MARSVLANSKFSRTVQAEVSVTFNSWNKRVQRTQSLILMIERLGIVLSLSLFTPRKMRERLRARSLRICSLGIFQLTIPKHNSSNFIKSTDKLTLLPWTRVSQVKVTSASRIMRLQRKLLTKQT